MTSSESEEPNVRAEPVPNWETATEEWDWAWGLHTYGFGAGFSLLGIYSIYTTIMLLKHNNGKLFITINMLVLLLCLLRSVFLFVDPYRSKEIFSELVAQMLFNVAFPCLTSGFSLVNWAFLESSKFKLLSPKLQNLRILIGIIIGHFIFVLTVDFVVAFLAEAWVLVMLCQGTFILWGLILCMGFSYSAWRVYVIKSKTRENMYRVNDTANGISGRFKFRKSKDRKRSRNESCNSSSNMSPGLIVNLGTTQKRFSFTGSIGNVTETYDSLKEESPSVATIQHKEMGCFDNNEVTVKTDLNSKNIFDTNRIVNANGTHENDAFGFGDEPMIDKNVSERTRPNQSTLEMDITTETTNKENSDERVNRNTLSKRATLFLMSVKGNRFLKKKQYCVRPVKKLSVNKKTSVTGKMMRITVVTTMFAAIICLVNTYAMFGVFSLLAEEKELEPWGWYAFQTAMRFCELGMGATMAYLTTTAPPPKTGRQH